MWQRCSLSAVMILLMAGLGGTVLASSDLPPRVSLTASRYVDIGASETFDAIVSMESLMEGRNFVFQMTFDPSALSPVLPSAHAVIVNTEVLPDTIPGWKMLASVFDDTLEIAGAALGATTAFIDEAAWVAKIPFLASESFSSDQQTTIRLVGAQTGHPEGRTTVLDVEGVALVLNPVVLGPDLDGDLDVDIDDFLLFAEVFGCRCGELCFNVLADLDGDCRIGVQDFLLFATYFGDDVAKLAALARDRWGIPLCPMLHQNHPNPFNPVTTISYELPEATDVRLRIYNVAGQEVETLVSDYRNAGRHEVTWNGGDHANGMYVVRFEAGGLVATRRMMLLK